MEGNSMAEILLVEDEESVNRGIEFLDIIRDHNYSLKMRSRVQGSGIFIDGFMDIIIVSLKLI